MKEFTKEVDHVTYHGFEVGDQSLPTLICLHGMTGDSNSFLELSSFLKPHFHLIMLDLPGHGETKSLRSEQEYTFTILADRMQSVFRSFTTPPFYILGHSWGADLALHIGKLLPKEVQGIILIDGGFAFPEYVEDMTVEQALIGWQDYIDSSTYSSWEEVIQTYQNYTTRPWDEKLDAIVRSNFKKRKGGYGLKADPFSLLAIIKAFYEEPCSTTHQYIKSPVLLFHATLPLKDSSRVRGLKAIRDNIETIETLGLNNTKHTIHWDCPAEVAKEIVSWKKKPLQ